MNWMWLVIAVAAIVLLIWRIRRKWVTPWSDVERMVGDIRQGKKPSTFVVEGADHAQRVALGLEELFERQRQLDQQLAERASGTQIIATAMQDALLVVDADHRVRLANRAFCELFNLPEAIPAIPVLEVVRDATIERVISDTLRSGEPQRIEFALSETRQKPPRFLQLSAVATKIASGQVTGAVVLLHDITQLKQADEIRRDFVANVSHELRTPLSILRGYIETLLEDPELSPTELNRILEVMKKHSDRLAALTDDLLTLARLESAQPNLQIADVRLSELFAGIVRDWGNKFAEKQLSFDVAVDPDVPMIRADATRLQEVLYNLLDNALKYSSPNGRIRLQASRRDDHVVLGVSDTGVGISQADLPRIFERFYRADKARSRELGGTGLGLSIVKHIAELHGGRAEAESTIGKGTTIRVVLPTNHSEHVAR
jgi:two-component system, OmpR family, phosphate regulon sensor histidine kinase PhoR